MVGGTYMESTISEFMLLAAKFEFFLATHNRNFVHIDGTTHKVIGMNWENVATSLSTAYPFNSFDFASSGFEYLVKTVPQHLIWPPDAAPRWDSEEVDVNSWHILIQKGYAQVRNNVAHGNKALLPAPFTPERTEKFIIAATALIHFVVEAHEGSPYWNAEIHFQ